jgi:hypothetical protein
MVTPSEEGVVLVEVPGIASSDFVARFVGDTVFVPYILLSDFLRIPNSVAPDYSTISGSIPSGSSFELSRLTRRGYVGTDTFAFDPASLRMIYGEVFVELSLYSRLVGLSTRLDLDRLTLIIEPSPRLPLVQWNQSRRRLGQLQNEEGPASRRRGRIERLLAGSPIVDWSVANYLASDRSSTSASLRLGAEILYGSLELNGALSTREDGGIAAAVSGGQWRYSMPEFAPLRQIAVGSVLIDDQSYTGIELTNIPLSVAEGFGSHHMTGRSQPGWMIEMYEGGRLVDMVQADTAGLFQFNVPMGYGTIDRTLRHVGPYGETLLERRRLQLNPLIIPVGDVHYSSRFGARSLGQSSPMAGVGEIDFGVTEYLSIGAEARMNLSEGAAPSLDSLRPVTFANLWLGESVSMGLRYMPRLESVSAGLYSVSADNVVLRGGIDSLSIANGTFASTAGVVLPIGNFSVGAAGRYLHGAGENELEVSPQFSGYVEGLSFTATTSFASGIAGSVGDLAIDTVPARRSVRTLMQMIATPLPGFVLTLQGRYDHTLEQLSMMELSSYFRLSDMAGISLGWELPELDVRQSSLQLQLSLDLGFSRGVVSSSVTGQQITSASFLQGSLLVSPRGVKMLPDFSVGQSAILLRAFADRNNNGRRDDDEEDLAAPGGALRLAGMETASPDGRFYQLPPNRECEVEVDRWFHTELGLFPSTSRYSLYTGSSSQQLIDIPFVEGFDVSGSCRMDTASGGGRISALNGLRIQLTSEATGSVYDGEIYTDGSIYIPSVGAGTYSIVFDESQLSSRRLKVIDLPDAIELTRENDRLPVVVFARR